MIEGLSSSPGAIGNQGEPASALNPNGLGKDEFLKLLMAQISNQSPLEPMDSQDFIAQLAQFSSVEQLTQLNEGIDMLHAGQAAIVANQSVALVDHSVVFAGNNVFLSEFKGEAPFRYELGKAAAKVEVTIKNEGGGVVRQMTFAGKTAGRHDGTWDGHDDSGTPVAAGRYKIEVKAYDGAGEEISVQTFSVGKVDSISLDNGYPELMISGVRIPPSDVLEIRGDS